MSVRVTENSQCIIDAYFSYQTVIPDNVSAIWYLNGLRVSDSNNIFKMAHAAHTFVLYVKAIKPYMAGKVECCLYQDLSNHNSKMIETLKGHLTVVNASSMNINSYYGTAFVQLNRRIAIMPQEADVQGLRDISVTNNVIVNLQREIYLDNTMGTFLLCYFYLYQNEIYYCKVIYDPFLVSSTEIMVERSKRFNFSLFRIVDGIEVKWGLNLDSPIYYTIEMTNNLEEVRNITPIPHYTSRPSFRVENLQKHKLVVVKVRSTIPSAEQTAYRFKRVILCDTPLSIVPPSSTPGPSLTACFKISG